MQDGCSDVPKSPSNNDHFPKQTTDLVTPALSIELGRGKKKKIKNKAYFFAIRQGARKSLLPASRPGAKLYPVLDAFAYN